MMAFDPLLHTHHIHFSYTCVCMYGLICCLLHPHSFQLSLSLSTISNHDRWSALRLCRFDFICMEILWLCVDWSEHKFASIVTRIHRRLPYPIDNIQMQLHRIFTHFCFSNISFEYIFHTDFSFIKYKYTNSICIMLFAF